MYSLKIANGRIVTEDAVFDGDILVKDGKIALVGDSDGIEAAETVDASGKYVFPGMIDSHVHLNDPGFTWREDYPSGTAAGAMGGVTTIIDMPLQNDPALTTAERFAAKEKTAAGRAFVDYAFWGGFVDDNIADLAAMDKCGAVAYKAFIGPVGDDYTAVDIGLTRKALLEAKKFDGMIGFHCEDHSMITRLEKEMIEKKGKENVDWRDFLDTRPVSAELISTYAVLVLARETGARVHICHVSHPDVAELIRRAKYDGVRVTAETCPHYLALTEEDVLRVGPFLKCAPPLRTADARDRLWAYVLDGTLASIASDHAPCRIDEKDAGKHGVLGIWGGISGLQAAMQIAFDQGVNRRGYDPRYLARSAAATAQTFSLAHKKGALVPGLDADIVVFDPEAEWEITADSLVCLNRFSGLVGLKGKGKPVRTVVRGVTVMRDGVIVGEPGYGRLVKKG